MNKLTEAPGPHSAHWDTRARAFSPTPRSASAARPARWPARNGTATPRTRSTNCSSPPMTTPAPSEPTPGAMSPSSSRTGSTSKRHANPAGRSSAWACRASGRRETPAPRRTPSGADTTPPDTPDFRWLMSSDVCKHCTNAGCLDVCPTGALFRTEHGTVVVQDDVCNGCGTCVAGCPFGVIERRSDGTAGLKARARLHAGGAGPDPQRRRRPEMHAVLRPDR